MAGKHYEHRFASLYTEFTEAISFLQMSQRFHGTSVAIESLTPVRKLRLSLNRFSRNLQIPNNITYRALVLNLNQIGQLVWKVQG